MAVPQIPQVVVQTAEGQTQEEDPGGAGLLVLDQVVAEIMSQSMIKDTPYLDA